MSALFLAELGERLFVHFVGGRWLAPVSTRLIPFGALPEGRQGHLVCGDDRDARRACGLLRPGQTAGLARAYDALRPDLAALCHWEGREDPVAPLRPVAPLGPGVLVTGPEVPLARVAALLIAAAGQGVVWRPDPACAASAHRLVAGLGPLAQGGIALVQGDGATAAALLACLPALRPPATG